MIKTAKYALLECKGGELLMEPAEESVHDFSGAETQSAKFNLTNKVIVLIFAAVVLGILSGFGFSRNASISGSTTTNSTMNLSNASKGTVVGSNDTKTFSDITEGIVKKGGIDGEGTFHLVRPGGESQNVYLTSSNIDLQALIDRKIKVWGQTIQAQHAGWLMDVGRVEVLQ